MPTPLERSYHLGRGTVTSLALVCERRQDRAASTSCFYRPYLVLEWPVLYCGSGKLQHAADFIATSKPVHHLPNRHHHAGARAGMALLHTCIYSALYYKLQQICLVGCVSQTLDASLSCSLHAFSPAAGPACIKRCVSYVLPVLMLVWHSVAVSCICMAT